MLCLNSEDIMRNNFYLISFYEDRVIPHELSLPKAYIDYLNERNAKEIY